MRYLLFFILLLTLARNSLAEELTKAQCNAVGGTHTKAGCLMLGASEKAKYDGANTHMPDKKECSCQGGTWHEEYGCLAKISKQECESLGGEMQAGIGCVQKLTEKKCNDLGGTINESGGCALKSQLNPEFKTDTGQKRTAP